VTRSAFWEIDAKGKGRVVDCSKEGFLTAMDISCWSFIRMAKLAEVLMRKGAQSTMTDYGSQMVVENYKMMGPLKAALKTSLSCGETGSKEHQSNQRLRTRHDLVA
jgi:enoyl-[acyl-carrier-protein] reductase (NADH)